MKQYTVIVYNDRTEWLNKDGEYHREDGPAIEYNDGSITWYKNGLRHRADGPASEYVNGTKEWWVKGKLHRTDGPAMESLGGAKKWYLNGQLHREDGPAMTWSSTGDKRWFLNNVEYSEKEYNKKMGTKEEFNYRNYDVGRGIDEYTPEFEKKFKALMLEYDAYWESASFVRDF